MLGRYAIAVAPFVWPPSKLYGQTAAVPQESSQTPRQALLEMFLATNPAQFLKHLPKDARTLAKRNAGVLPLQEIPPTIGELRMPGRKLKTLDGGPLLLRSENPYSKQAVEITVDSEYAGLDEAGMQLRPQVYLIRESRRLCRSFPSLPAR